MKIHSTFQKKRKRVKLTTNKCVFRATNNECFIFNETKSTDMLLLRYRTLGIVFLY